MAEKMTTTGRATIALAAANSISDGELAGLLGLDPATVSRKKNGKGGWTDADALRVVTALGDRIDPLIRDLKRLRDTDEYRQADTAPAGAESHVA